MRSGQTRRACPRVPLTVVAAGVGFGIALWFLMGHLTGGDDLFHLARVRKLDDFGSLSLRSVDEFRDGGLHPGYAFPLWHLLPRARCAARRGRPDGGCSARGERARAGRVPRRVGVGQGGLPLGLGRAGGARDVRSGSSRSPPAAAARTRRWRSRRRRAGSCFVPAVIALFFAFVAERSRGGLATIACRDRSARARSTRPTRSSSSFRWSASSPPGRCSPGARSPRVCWASPPSSSRRGWSRSGCARSRARPRRSTRRRTRCTVRSCTTGASSTSSRTGATGSRRRCSAGAGRSPSRRCSPCRLPSSRPGAAGPRSCSAGSSLVLALMLLPELFTRFADAVSISQARRAAGFVPFALRPRRRCSRARPADSRSRALPIGLGAGIALQLAYPGDFGYALDQGGPAIVTWIALVGGGGGAGRRDLPPAAPRRARPHGWLTAATAFAGRAADRAARVHPLGRETDDVEAADPGADRGAADEGAGAAPSSSPTTTRATRSPPTRPSTSRTRCRVTSPNTKANRPYERRADAKQFFRTGDLAIPRRYGATWLVIRTARSKLMPDLPKAYADKDYVLYRL